MTPTIICLTPVRNEAWILDRFLQATSLWADYIIIADQMSTDGSREIALKYPKVILVDNNSSSYDEAERQRLLISEARKIAGPRLLITLDADEIFTPNVLNSEEWKAMLTAEPGTIFKFQWANLRPDFKTFWYGYSFPWGYMDDGHEHNTNNKMHNYRIPMPLKPVATVEINSIKVMHFQFTDWQRMESKHRWYQLMEVNTYPEKSKLEIYRQYNHMYASQKYLEMPSEWFSDYKKWQIDLEKQVVNKKIWFDQESLKLIRQFGAKKYRKLAIWNANWKEIATLWGEKEVKIYKDPRTLLDRMIQFWLIKTRKVQHRRFFRRLDNQIKRIFKY